MSPPQPNRVVPKIWQACVDAAVHMEHASPSHYLNLLIHGATRRVIAEAVARASTVQTSLSSVLSLESNKTCDCSFSHNFGICTLLYARADVLGYTMIGEAILSQFTLNMPKELVATKIAVWTTLEWEEVQRVTSQRWEREQGCREAVEDMSEDLSEGEKGDNVVEMVQSDTPKKKFQRQTSNLEVWSDDKKEKKLYVVLLRYILLSTLPKLF
ncbi:hypothetical protein JHK82_044353 [Glycine max]|nr:hypothetical protein JHK82_044353 [Glycine max]